MIDYTYLDIADKDLEAALLLYQNQLYPQSIFLLQQATEKGHKHLMKANFNMDIAWLTKASHFPKRLVKHSEKLSSEIAEKFGEAPDEMSAFLQKIKAVPEVSDKVSMVLKELRKIRFTKVEDHPIYHQLDLLNKYLTDPDFIRARVVGVDPEGMDSMIKLMSIITSDYMQEFMMATKPVSYIAIQAGLLSEHVGAVRYPASDGRGPSYLYTPSHPLVENFPELAEGLGEQLGICRQWQEFVLDLFSKLE